jgi:DsbC/DsbD-like thiol-disulfide interchange protein/cytochrome c biogenesis protein CcdA
MMTRLPFLLPALLTGLFAALLVLLPPTARAASEVTTPQVRAELLAHAPEGVAVGKPLWLGLLIEHQPHWHTYWKNPGDSGLPTTLQWTLPAGTRAGDIRWPTPKKLPVGPLMNFGYEGRLLLPVPVTVAAAPAGDTLKVKLDAEWLVCKDVCIPESGSFTLELPVQAATAAHGALFAAAEAAMPQPVPGAEASARVEGDALVIDFTGLPAAWRGRALDILPETAGVILNAAKPQTRWDGERWRASLPLDPQRSDSPAAMPLVLVSDGQPAGLQLTATVTTPWPALASLPAAPAPALGDAVVLPPAAPAAGVGFGLALLLALLGGALLNLMPCVFPVLSLKVFGFAAHAQDRRGLLAGGLAYTAGVVLSFVALAGLLLVLRAGGEQLGWGFQLQSPAFVAALAALFTLIGLNLAGAFEFGSVLPARWSAARARHPMVDSLLTGVLAVAVASPCTAPFMGASLGVAVTMPAAQALAGLRGAGPGHGRALPAGQRLAGAGARAAAARPMDGALQDADGLPDVCHRGLAGVGAGPADRHRWRGGLAGRTGGAGLPGLGAGLAGTLGSRARAGFGATAVVLGLAVLAWALPSFKPVEAATAAPSEAGWEAWSPERVAELQAAGRPVFVDFTAAWCVTCQVQQAHHAGRCRGAGGLPRAQRGAAARRLDAPRCAHHRRTHAAGPHRRAGLCALCPWCCRARLLSEILGKAEVQAPWPICADRKEDLR